MISKCNIYGNSLRKYPCDLVQHQSSRQHLFYKQYMISPESQHTCGIGLGMGVPYATCHITICFHTISTDGLVVRVRVNLDTKPDQCFQLRSTTLFNSSKLLFFLQVLSKERLHLQIMHMTASATGCSYVQPLKKQQKIEVTDCSLGCSSTCIQQIPFSAIS